MFFNDPKVVAIFDFYGKWMSGYSKYYNFK